MKIPHDVWFKLPMLLRERWWRETNYNRTEPSQELEKAVRDAAAAAFLDLPWPDDK